MGNFWIVPLLHSVSNISIKLAIFNSIPDNYLVPKTLNITELKYEYSVLCPHNICEIWIFDLFICINNNWNINTKSKTVYIKWPCTSLVWQVYVSCSHIDTADKGKSLFRKIGIYQTTRRRIPEDSTPYQYRWVNLTYGLSVCCQ
jgi:hypothetical protein